MMTEFGQEGGAGKAVKAVVVKSSGKTSETHQASANILNEYHSVSKETLHWCRVSSATEKYYHINLCFTTQMSASQNSKLTLGGLHIRQVCRQSIPILLNTNISQCSLVKITN